MGNNEILNQMDAAGDAAEQELRALVKSTPKEDLAALFKWYQNWYMKAGYKRLGRTLVALAKEYEAQNVRVR